MRRRAILLTFALSLFASNISTAQAHTGLLSSSPKAASVISTWPTKVTLTFNEAIVVLPAKSVNWIIVKDSLGHRVDLGKSSVKGSTIFVGLKPSATEGRFQVQYRVVSGDGHPVTNNFSFRYKK